MKLKSTDRYSCYCAFCKQARKIYKKKHIRLSNVFYSMILSLLVMFAIWQRAEPRVLLFFSLSLVMSEMFIYLRWRLTITCPHCGFDPVIYLKDISKAVELVRNHLDRRAQDPSTLLKTPLQLPKKKGSILSKQV